jgi:hypothetical protein
MDGGYGEPGVRVGDLDAHMDRQGNSQDCSGRHTERHVDFPALGPTKEAAMTGPRRRPQARPLDAGHGHAPFPGAGVLRRRLRTQTACPCRRGLAVGSRSLEPRNHGPALRAGRGGHNEDILRGYGVGLYQLDVASLHCNTAAPAAALCWSFGRRNAAIVSVPS